MSQKRNFKLYSEKSQEEIIPDASLKTKMSGNI